MKLAVHQGSKAEDIVVDGGDLYRVTFSTKGGVVKSWVLKKYQDDKGLPLDLVDRAACETLGYPLSLNLADPSLRDKLNNALFVVRPGAGTLKATAKLEFFYSDGKVAAKKQFSFGPGYDLAAEVSVFDGERYLPVEVAWPGGLEDHSLPQALAALADQVVYQRVPASGVTHDNLVPSIFSRLLAWLTGGPQKASQAEISGPLTLAGVEDRYFAAVLLPDDHAGIFRANWQVWTPVDWKGEDSQKPKLIAASLGTSEPKPFKFRMFVGPKSLDILQAENPPLDGLLDFGKVFGFVAKPLFLVLRYIYEHWVHNYGWAIVILTVIINMGLFPLKMKSIKSAQEMQRVAPMVKSIQERYKQYKFNDPRKQRMNQEIMKLYQEHGINPLGGCLPMVLQLPILYGFYSVLQVPIELRHAAWIFWIKDLAAKDPSHLFGLPISILPTIMVITMFVVQKMTPMATADPAQQKMMTIFMPLMFGFMFYNLASGLVLYFLTANLVGIAQQAFINWRMPATQAASPKTQPLKP